MCIDDGTIGLLKVANKKPKHPHLHFEPRLVFIPFHHLEEGRSDVCNFLAKGRYGGGSPGLMLCSGRNRTPPFVPNLVHAAHLKA
jgi:hypothetical protein